MRHSAAQIQTFLRRASGVNRAVFTDSHGADFPSHAARFVRRAAWSILGRHPKNRNENRTDRYHRRPHRCWNFSGILRQMCHLQWHRMERQFSLRRLRRRWRCVQPMKPRPVHLRMHRSVFQTTSHAFFCSNTLRRRTDVTSKGIPLWHPQIKDRWHGTNQI